MNGLLSKLGTALAVVFSVLVVVVLAEIFYVCYRRRKFRQSNRVEVDSERFSGTDQVANPPSSKELLLYYYFCWKTQTPIEPEGYGYPTTQVQPDAPPVSDDGNAMKWQGLYGPSRFLFTIKEEEREDMDSSAEKTTTTRDDVVVSLEEEEEEKEQECFGRANDEVTPFSTPCGSPFYYTPAASPTREMGNGGGGGILTDTPRNIVGEVSFVSLEVHGD